VAVMVLALAVPVSEMVTPETQGPVTVPESEQFVVQLGVTVKADPLLATVKTVTTTFPVVVVVGTVDRRRLMYMIREVFRAQRGKAPELIAIFQTLDQVMMAQAGFSQGKIYADMSGPMDTVIYEFLVH